MTEKLRVLIVEDSEDDALLIVNEIKEGGCDPKFERVETKEAFLSALKKGDWDLIISDYSLPKFSGLDAVKLLKESGIDLPFILVSGEIGEEIAVESLLAGAHDFIVKGKWGRLVPAIKRELKDAKVRQEQKLGEEKLKESEERYRSLTETATDAIISTDCNGIIVFWNKGAQAIFGYTTEDVTGKPLTVLMPEKYRSAHTKAIKQASKTGILKATGKNLELFGLKRDGREFPIELSLAYWKKGEEIFYSGIIRDITERKEIESQLRQSQKMEAIGTLAGGIAHDFNNMLTGIIGYTEMTMDSLNPENDLYDNLQKALKSSYSARDIVAQLLTFSRKTEEEKEILLLTDLASDTLKLIGSSLPSNVSIEKSMDENLHQIMGSAIQIQQILMNLCINAGHAMPEGGNLKITFKNHYLDKFKISQDQEISGLYVVLSVEDSGIGMDKDVVERIFEPFFTTKEVGKGTGLGLSTVFGIVKQHDGYITVDSKKGIGTIFHVYIPALKKDDESILKTDSEKKPSGKMGDFEDSGKVQNRFKVQASKEEFVVNITGNNILNKSNEKQLLDYYVLARNDRKKIIVDCESGVEKHLKNIGFNKFLEVRVKD